jgi:hypothetical protein
MMRWFSLVGGSLVIVTAAVAGCYSGDAGSEASPVSAGNSTVPDPSAGSGGAGGASGSGAAATGLPCEVDALLTKRCRSCHGSPLMAPMALVTYEDLAAPAKSAPAKSNAVLALERMTATTAPMPPSGERATDAEITVFRAWVEAGLPRGRCGGAEPLPDGGVATPKPSQPLMSVCSSGKTWTSTSKGAQMNPGRACITCHQQHKQDETIVRVGGTVYPTLREPDLCYGIDGPATGAQVIITDAAGRVFTLPVGATGNFSLQGEASIQMPFRAKVIRNGVERQMNTPQSTGDCNSCHTETGVNGAPGRILLP